MMFPMLYILKPVILLNTLLLHALTLHLPLYISSLQLVVEGARARQLRDTLLMEKQTMYSTFQQASSLVDYFEIKTSRIEDQVLTVLFFHRIYYLY